MKSGTMPDTRHRVTDGDGEIMYPELPTAFENPIQFMFGLFLCAV